jgi:hypothetical protein
VSADTYWSATGAINAIKYAVIRSGTNLLCYCTLTSSGVISLTSGSRLTIQYAAGGVLTLT